MPLLPTVPNAPSSGPSEDPAIRRAEFDRLSLELQQHRKGEIVLDASDYAAKLRRAIDLAQSFNQTTAGPKAKAKSKAAPPKPTNFADFLNS